jgi:hypothetical protein
MELNRTECLRTGTECQAFSSRHSVGVISTSARTGQHLGLNSFCRNFLDREGETQSYVEQGRGMEVHPSSVPSFYPARSAKCNIGTTYVGGDTGWRAFSEATKKRRRAAQNRLPVHSVTTPQGAELLTGRRQVHTTRKQTFSGKKRPLGSHDLDFQIKCSPLRPRFITVLRKTKKPWKHIIRIPYSTPCP